jgi:hypothetical protein
MTENPTHTIPDFHTKDCQTTTMLQSFDARMQRAVQQESRTLSSSLTNKTTKKGSAYGVSHQRGCLIILVFIPIVLVVIVVVFLREYNSMQAFDQEMVNILKLTEDQATLQKQGDEEAVSAAATSAEATPLAAEATRDVLVIATKLGDIRVVLRPDLSSGSVDYVHQLVESNKCDRCSFYRADERGILQGIMKKKDIPTNTILGSCPAGSENVKNACPAWDKNCSCHGPVMTRGAVAWAAGQSGGPDFFIDNYRVST